MDSSPHVWLCACKSATLAHELLVSVGPSPHLWFLHAKQRLLYEHTSLYEFQTSTVASCIQNSVISIWITSLYGSKPLSLAFAWKPAPFGAELQVSIGPRPHLSLCAWKTAWFSAEPQVHMGSSPHLFFLFFFIRNSDFGPDWQVCMGPRPHLWFWAHITACLA